jgi:hypothetical protein
MRSGNTEHLLPNTENAGQTEYVLGMYALVFVLVMAMTGLQILQYKADSDIAEDAVAASCLAALDVDPYRYGADHRLVINDPAHAREIFTEALKGNMDLTDDMSPAHANSSYIAGRVEIKDFRIYNVDGDSVTEYVITETGITENTGVYGNVSTPSGAVVSSAGAYAEITFDTKGFMGVSVRADKEAYAEMIAESD